MSNQTIGPGEKWYPKFKGEIMENDELIGPGPTGGYLNHKKFKGTETISDKKREQINKVVKKHKERLVKLRTNIAKESELEARVKILEERLKVKDNETIAIKDIEEKVGVTLIEIHERIDKIEKTIRDYGIFK